MVGIQKTLNSWKCIYESQESSGTCVVACHCVTNNERHDVVAFTCIEDKWNYKNLSEIKAFKNMFKSSILNKLWNK